MKKRMLAALTAALCLLAAAGLGEETTLPAAVTALCEAVHPGYEVTASSGWGDESRGQVALVLSRDGENILCIAEKAEGDAGYAFTVDNPNAVRSGERVPSLFIDTVDTLFYGYEEGEGLYAASYNSVKRDGEWGPVNVTWSDRSHAAYDLELWMGVSGGMLCMEQSRWDKLENRMDGSDLPRYLPVPVSEAYERGLALAAFDITAFDVSWGQVSAAPGLCDGLLETGDELLQLDIQAENLLMLVRKADGARRIRIAESDYAVRETGPVPENASMDTFHMGDGTLYLGADGNSFNFSRLSDGGWYLSNVQGEEVFDVFPNGIGGNDADAYYLRSDGITYGEHPWGAEIAQLDLLALPRTRAEAMAQLDSSGYALVNNPNPADRLHLRAEPSRSAASLGKFYNRTPVYVLEEKGDWVRVRVGSEEGGLTGYMMKEYLAMGGGNPQVKCAYEQLFPREGLESVELLAEPQRGAAAVCVLGGHEWYNIIGVVGDDWLIVMTRDGTVGYAPRADFWAGNG